MGHGAMLCLQTAEDTSYWVAGCDASVQDMARHMMDSVHANSVISVCYLDEDGDYRPEQTS